MQSKANHFRRLSLVFDNTGAILAWLVVVNIAIMAGNIPPGMFFPYAAVLALIVPLQVYAFNAFYVSATRIIPCVRYVASVTGISMLGLFALDFVLGLNLSRIVVFGYGFLSLGGLLSAKIVTHFWYFHGRKERIENYTKVLIVGSGPRAVRTAELLTSNAEWGVHIIGYVDPDIARTVTGFADTKAISATPNGLGQSSAIAPMVRNTGDIQQILSANVVDEVVIALPRRFLGELEELVETCEEEGIRIRLLADLYDTEVASMKLEILGGVPMVEFVPVAQNENILLVKRIFDLVVTIAAIPVLIPLFGFVALCIKLDSQGPVFFKQERVGLNKRGFQMYKFRSMFADAEERMAELEHLNEAHGPIFKIRNDPRITRVGRFIRKTSLDEFPQLINVLFGQMSLVGPRPMSLRDVNLFDRSVQRRRFSVRPGCTCVREVSGRSDLPFDKWLELDLEYIENWSIALDLKILLKTIPSVIKGAGAS